MKKIDFKGFRARIFSQIRFGLVAGSLALVLGLATGTDASAADIALDGNWISTGVSPVSGNISGYGYYQDLAPCDV